MKRYILTLVFAISALLCAAQNDRNVRGRVFDADGEPIPNATLRAVGTNIQSKAAADGTFDFNVPYYSNFIEASAPGYLSQSVEVDGAYMVFKLKVDKKYVAAKAKAEDAAQNAELEKARSEALARMKAEEAKQKADQEARRQADQEARRQAEQEAAAKAKAEEAARKEAAAKAKAEEAARKEAAAKAKAEEAKLKAEQEARRQAELAAQKAAQEKARAEENARLEAIKKAKQDSLAAIKAADKAQKKAVSDAYNKKYRNKGLIHNFELNYSYYIAGTNEVVYENYGVRKFNSVHPIEFTYSIGYRFCNWVSLSLGAGLCYEALDLTKYGDRFAADYYKNEVEAISNYSNILIPLFLNTKFYLSRGANQPIVSLTGGTYLLSAGVQTLVDLGLGYNIRLNKRCNMYVMGSLALYPLLYSDVSDWGLSASRNSDIMPRVKVGFTF